MGVLWFEVLVTHKEFVTDTVIAASPKQLEGFKMATCSYTAPAVLLSSHKQEGLPFMRQIGVVRLLCCTMPD